MQRLYTEIVKGIKFFKEKNMNHISLKKYKNELKCIFQKDEFNDICTINIFYPINMDCERENKGIGCFTSRMMLKGTKSLAAGEFALELEKNAVFLDVNRTTSYINFSLSFDRKLFCKAIDLFMDALENPKFDDREINKLKKEFINALSARYDDISTVCSDEFLRIIYGERNYKSWCVLGIKEHIESLEKSKLEDFHKFFILGNAPIISIIGNLDYSEVENYFLNKFSKFEFNKALKKPTDNFSENQFDKQDKKIEVKKDFNQSYIMQGILVPSICDEHLTSLKLLNNYLGYGMSSVFFDRIREEMGLVYEIGSYASSYNSENYWAVYLGLDRKNVDLALDAIGEEMKRLCREKISLEKLKILKAKTKRYEIFKQQKKASRCFYLGLFELLGLGYNYRNEYLEKIDKISIEEMNESIDFLFKDKQKFTAIIL